MLFEQLFEQNPLRAAITNAYRRDETLCINTLLPQAALSPDAVKRIQSTASDWVKGTRQRLKKQSLLHTFLHEYNLSSTEGIALMCLAEALLRIPDPATADKLIADKLQNGDWTNTHTNNSLFANAAAWSLMITGKIFSAEFSQEKTLFSTLTRLISRVGEAVLRPIVLQGMKIIGKQFVMGNTIDEALKRARILEKTGYRYSYDMLGEAARTTADAVKYFNAYYAAIEAVGAASEGLDTIHSPGVSVKLSALHPRYECAQRERVLSELVPRVLELAKLAKKFNIGLTIDAEESERLELSLDVIEAVFSSPELEGWEGFGLAVQAYQKRAPFVIDWLIDLSQRQKCRIMIRLIKGAYWDTEIKNSQVLGLSSYPVFTRKNATDVSFIACAKKILAHRDCFYPQFGTHNAYCVAAILEIARDQNNPIDFEFQCLHGMGEPLYNQIVEHVPCRIYAPVGHHKELLSYLVRRLLENGANTSFVHHIADEDVSIDEIVADPVNKITQLVSKPHPRIPLPEDIFGAARKNSTGLDLSNCHELNQLKKLMDAYERDKKNIFQEELKPASLEIIEETLVKVSAAKTHWANTPVIERAACLQRAADLLEENMPEFLVLLCREAGKTIPDSIGEIREAVDFCRYYALRAIQDFEPQTLIGATGENNQLSLHPRGLIGCISPWNFPLAIFMGQITAALASGNVVIAKPAEPTPRIAQRAIELLHEAGIPQDVLQILIGSGRVAGSRLAEDERVDGILFTGSTETAKSIQQALANRSGAIVPLVAETGGQNAMIVDSSALPEQVVVDVMQSAFNSAGQRCSALRVLFLQEEIADTIIELLKGAMAECIVGDPGLLSTDIGPVITSNAAEMLQKHVSYLQEKQARLIYQMPLDNNIHSSNASSPNVFFAPCAFEIENLNILKREVFGPILHIIRYSAKNLDSVLNDIMSTGYGLTLGIHSRIDATIEKIVKRVSAGNIYINRNMIGAVVGVQPFGGEKLSGTGPKAGGPYYLPRLCVERTVSKNTTAAGGNTTLISLVEN